MYDVLSSVLISYQSGDLSFTKGSIITITNKSESVDDWYVNFLHPRSTILMVSVGGQERSTEEREFSPPTLLKSFSSCVDSVSPANFHIRIL